MKNKKSSNKKLVGKKLSDKHVLFSPANNVAIDSMIENELSEILIFLQKKLPKHMAVGVLQNKEITQYMLDLMFDYFIQNYNKIFTNNIYLSKKDCNISREKNEVQSSKEIEIEEKINLLEEKMQEQELNASFFTTDIQNHLIVKCSIKDNIIKPRTVSDLSLAINLPASAFFPDYLLYQATVEYFLKNILTKYYIDVMEEEIKTLNAKKKVDTDVLYLEDLQKKMKKLATDSIDFDDPIFQSKYSILFDVLTESIYQLGEGDIIEDCQQELQNIGKIDLENFRDDNFSVVGKRLASIIDSSSLGYQYIENIKRERVLILKEYEDEDELSLPDERYKIQLIYYTQARLANIRKMYKNKVFSCANKAEHLLSIVDSKLYGDAYSLIINSTEDLQENYKKYLQECVDFSSHPEIDSFFYSSYIDAKDDKTFIKIKNDVRKNFNIIEQRINEIYGQRYPVDRRVLKDRLASLKEELDSLDSLVNPFYLVPGFSLEVIATSIKRKRTTFTTLKNAIITWLKTFEKTAISEKLARHIAVKKRSLGKQLIEKDILKINNKIIDEKNLKEELDNNENVKARSEDDIEISKLKNTEKRHLNLHNEEVVEKRKRGRPKKVASIETENIKQVDINIQTLGTIEKRKRGRPKKEEGLISVKKKNKTKKQNNLFKEI